MLRRTSAYYFQPRYFSLAATLANKEKYFSELGKKETSDKPTGWENAKPYESIPGPKPLPIVGNMLRMTFGKFNIKQDFSKIHKLMYDMYGNIATYRKLGQVRDFVFIYETDEIETMFRNEGVWPMRDGFQAVNEYRNVVRKGIFTETGSLLSNHGEEWHNFRSKVNPILMQPRTAEQYIGVLNDVGESFIERVEHLINTSGKEMPADFEHELCKWAFESIGTVALDRRLGCLDKEPNLESQTMVKYMVEIFEMFNTLDFTPMGAIYRKYNFPIWKRFVKYQDYFTDLAFKYIEEAAEKIKADPNYVTKTQREKSAFEQFLEKDKKIAVVMTLDMLLAGIDTTGKATAGILYHLSKHPEIQSKLREELIKVLPNKNTPITKEILSKTPYLKAVFTESLRLAPITEANWRVTTKEMVLNGYQIPKGVIVIVPNLLLCKQEKHFARALEFLPERWLRTSDGDISRKNINPFVSLPFGFGPRSCIGKRVATLEIEMLIAKVIRNYVLTWPHADMKFGQKFLYGIRDPLKLHLEPVSK